MRFRTVARTLRRWRPPSPNGVTWIGRAGAFLWKSRQGNEVTAGAAVEAMLEVRECPEGATSRGSYGGCPLRTPDGGCPLRTPPTVGVPCAPLDDEGVRHGPVTLAIDAGEARQLQLGRPGARQPGQGTLRQYRLRTRRLAARVRQQPRAGRAGVRPQQGRLSDIHPRHRADDGYPPRRAHFQPRQQSRPSQSAAPGQPWRGLRGSRHHRHRLGRIVTRGRRHAAPPAAGTGAHGHGAGTGVWRGSVGCLGRRRRQVAADRDSRPPDPRGKSVEKPYGPSHEPLHASGQPGAGQQPGDDLSRAVVRRRRSERPAGFRAHRQSSGRGRIGAYRGIRRNRLRL